MMTIRHAASISALMLAMPFDPASATTQSEGPFPVACNGMVVGELSVQVGLVTISAGPPEVKRLGLLADFSPAEPLSLVDVYTKCGVTGLNWLQVVTSTVHKPVDSKGKELTPPFLDPPLGGYGDNPATPGNDTLPMDQYKMYWNVGNFGKGDQFHIDTHTKDDVLDFEDSPTWPTNTQYIEFSLWLVGYDSKYNIVNSSLGVVKWTWDNRSGQTDIKWHYAGVPEPKSWFMMLAGFGILGWRIRSQSDCRGRRTG